MTTPTGTLGVQLYSVREPLAADRPGTLAKLADIGYRQVEPFGLGDWNTPADERLAKARALRADLDAAGLTATSLHAGVSADGLDVLAEEAKIVGADTVFAPIPGLVQGFDGEDGMGAKLFGDREAVTRLAARLSEAAAELEGHGIRLGYHNHDAEWTLLPDGRPGYDLLWELADPSVLAEVDVYWATVGGQDPAAVLGALGERAVALHLKDGKATRGAPQTPIGTGDVPIAAAVAAAPHARWHIAEIDATEHDLFELLAANRATLGEQGRTEI